MKISITDKFLWDLYTFVEKTDDLVDFILSSDYRKVSILLGDQDPIIRKYYKDIGRKNFSKLIHYLKKNNFIKSKNLENKKAIMITNKGIDKVLKTSFDIEVNKKRKDGKWIMLMFDVPEKSRRSRRLLRSILHNLGYKIFQKSVWISPYDVSKKTEKLLQLYSLDKYVKIFLIEKVNY